VYDGALASGVAGMIDTFAAANSLRAETDWSSRAEPVFDWRIESPDSEPVPTASGQMVPVDGPTDGDASAGAVILPGPFAADIGRLLAQMNALESLLAALRRQHGRGALASYRSASLLLAEAGFLDGALRPRAGPSNRRSGNAVRLNDQVPMPGILSVGRK
jgi:transcriptional regulator GlxA family with amidase domain